MTRAEFDSKYAATPEDTDGFFGGFSAESLRRVNDTVFNRSAHLFAGDYYTLRNINREFTRAFNHFTDLSS